MVSNTTIHAKWHRRRKQEMPLGQQSCIGTTTTTGQSSQRHRRLNFDWSLAALHAHTHHKSNAKQQGTTSRHSTLQQFLDYLSQCSSGTRSHQDFLCYIPSEDEDNLVAQHHNIPVVQMFIPPTYYDRTTEWKSIEVVIIKVRQHPS